MHTHTGNKSYAVTNSYRLGDGLLDEVENGRVLDERETIVEQDGREATIQGWNEADDGGVRCDDIHNKGDVGDDLFYVDSSAASFVGSETCISSSDTSVAEWRKGVRNFVFRDNYRGNMHYAFLNVRQLTCTLRNETCMLCTMVYNYFWPSYS